jgi:chaperonin GroES
MKIKKLAPNRVIGKKILDEKTAGGIVVPEIIQKDKAFKTLVVAVGPGKVINSKGDRLEVDIKPGDIVIVTKYSQSNIRLDGEAYDLFNIADVLAKLE